MPTTITAIFQDGVLKPTRKLKLHPNEKVKLNILRQDRAIESTDLGPMAGHFLNSPPWPTKTSRSGSVCGSRDSHANSAESSARVAPGDDLHCRYAQLDLVSRRPGPAGISCAPCFSEATAGRARIIVPVIVLAEIVFIVERGRVRADV